MKIFTEKEQKQNKITELVNLKSDLVTEIRLINDIRDAEMNKKDFWARPKPDWNLIYSLDDRIASLHKAANCLNEYKDLIEESIKDNK